MLTANMPTIEERENLMKPQDVHHPGFHPRPIQRLAVRKPPKTMLNIECNHYLRSNTETFAHGHPTVEYKLWLEAGKHDAPFPQRPDESFNANVWRNFRRQYGFHTSAGGKMSDIIAAMYPLNIPSPSKVGQQTFEKYIRETRLFNDDKFKSMAMSRTKADLEEFRKLRIKSMSRNPPIDEQGHILPPENFKKYEPHLIKPVERPPTPPPPNQKTDSLGQRYVPKSRPHLWKLSYKINNPEYDSVKKEIRKRKELEGRMKERERQSPGHQIGQIAPSPVNPPASVT
ncbi:TEX52-like protein [Mya arenaria]|nr:TEX52-like protein [Mya arenaria]